MIITQNYFNKYLDSNFLFEKSPKIAVAVSGGPDSMCLLFLLSNWIKICKGDLIILIIDHNIREESAYEANSIKKYLLLNNMQSKIICINKTNISKKTMMEARNNRYEELIKYCSKKKLLHLFLGHHSDDNIETYLLRKIGGSNFEGLRAMQNKLFNINLQILRPLLIFNKKNILDFNKKNKIEFITDPSNGNLKYSRVVVRNYISKNLKIKKKIRNDFEIIKKIFPLYKKMIFQKFNNLVLNINTNEIAIDSKKFLKEELEIQSKIIEIIYAYVISNYSIVRNVRYKK